VSQRKATFDLLAGLHNINYSTPQQVRHTQNSPSPLIWTVANLAVSYRRHELLGLQTLQTHLRVGWGAKGEGERPHAMTSLANHRSVPGNKMSYSCLSCLQCTMSDQPHICYNIQRTRAVHTEWLWHHKSGVMSLQSPLSRNHNLVRTKGVLQITRWMEYFQLQVINWLEKWKFYDETPHKQHISLTT
jgi:hypothetical protein